MSYLAITQMAASVTLTHRVQACMTLEGVPDAPFVAQNRIWDLVSREDWARRWLASENELETRGEDESAITDGMILAAVQALRAEES